MSEAKKLAARVAATERWICQSPHERSVATRPGRAAFDARFEREADARWPGLDAVERARRVQHLRTLYFTRIRLGQLRGAKERERQLRSEQYDGRQRVSLDGIEQQ